MEIRLNKLISDSGICSRREADKFIAMGRVTVNGKSPEVGQKVTEKDIILVDDNRIQVGKNIEKGSNRTISGKVKNLMFGEGVAKKASTSPKQDPPRQKSPSTSNMSSRMGDSTHKKTTPPPHVSAVQHDGTENESSSVKKERYGKYNKYAAARKAAAKGEKWSEKNKSEKKEKAALKEATQPKFGKSLSRSAVAQRLASAPKSASLRKTSKNNPINKAKHIARNKPKEDRE